MPPTPCQPPPAFLPPYIPNNRLAQMDLFLVPNNIEKTVLVSANGVAHYQVTTVKRAGIKVSRIQRPAETEEESIVADIEWKGWDRPTVIKSPLLGGRRRVSATNFLYKRSQFSSTRYFLGDDDIEYRWKRVKGLGYVLTSRATDEQVARFTCEQTNEGLYAGERKSHLHILPSSLDIDLIVLSFVIMEKKRRDHMGDGTHATAHDEDPGEAGGAEGADGGAGASE